MDQSGESGVTKGSIVWVRRRNGSWWPGKILGPEDLSAAHLTSPRAGTPVKLLGREDASVDWYNLEKSKRVKPFRCGDFDDCIQRAEASQSMPMKKREKYARREDAILHALELEKQQLFQTQSKLDTPRSSIRASAIDSSTVVVEKGLVATSDSLVHINGDAQLGNVTVAEFTGRVDAFSRDGSTDNLSSLQKPKDEKELNWEDDIPEGIPRMRGLQDFGLKIASSKRRHASCAVPDAVRKPPTNSLPHPVLDHDLSIRSTSHSDGSEEVAVVHRAKRSRCVYFPEDHSGSMDEKEVSHGRMEIPPAALGESNCNAPLVEENASRFLKGGGRVPFELESSESESDSSETEEELDEDEETTSISEMEFGGLGVHGRGEHGSMSSDEPDDSPHSADTSHLSPHDAISANEAMSMWPMKGKRNVRNLTRRPIDTIHERGAFGPTNGVHSNGRGIKFGQRASDWISGCHYGLNDSLYDIEADDKDLDFHCIELDLDYAATSTSVYRGHGFRSYGVADAIDFAWEGERYNPVYTRQHPDGRRRPTLVEVDLKVQVSYPKERVPIVSTTSKLTGNSIIGHSLRIEAVEDGSSGHLFPSNNDSGNEMVDNNNEARALAPAWRTARRTTNFRAPRSHSLAAYDVDEDIAASYSQQERKSLSNVGLGSFGRKGLLVRKGIANVHPPQTNRKSSKKLTKRMNNMSSSQKIRTLSSIAVEQNFSNRSMYDADCRMDGIIKPGSSGPPTVACIPVKLAFSRLLEKINRPPSKAVIKMVRMSSSGAEKGQS